LKTRKTKIEEIAFTMIPLVGPIIARQLLAYCGSIEGVFGEQKRFLKSIPGIGEEIATQVARCSSLLQMQKKNWPSWRKKTFNMFFSPTMNILQG
jgi:ERCC4-type nuclease